MFSDGGLARRGHRGQHRLGRRGDLVELFRLDDPGRRLGGGRRGQAGQRDAPVEPCPAATMLRGLVVTSSAACSLASRAAAEPRPQLADGACARP